jgi:hypothetical protein
VDNEEELEKNMPKELKDKLYQIFLRDQEINNLIKKVPQKYFYQDEEDEDVSQQIEEEIESEHLKKPSIQVRVSMPTLDENSGSISQRTE